MSAKDSTGRQIVIEAPSHFKQQTSNIVGNGAGAAVDMTAYPMSKFTIIVRRTAGATDVINVRLRGSYDNVAWVDIGTVTSVTSTPGTFSLGDRPHRYMQYNVVTVGAGNTLEISLLALP